MIEGLLGLLACQLAGTALADGLHLKVPGPVLGMLILLAVLTVRRPRPDAPVMRAGNRVLDELPLLFIPAGVGVIGCTGLLRAHWGVLLLGLVLPWAAGLAVTAGVATLADHTIGSAEEEELDAEAADLVADSRRMDGIEPDDDPAPDDEPVPAAELDQALEAAR